jgi:hypothetical protein
MIMKKLILLFFLIWTSCDKGIELPAADIPRDKYYSSEIIPGKYLGFYGKWKSIAITGGFSGGTRQPDFDFLIIQNFGIYSIIKNEKIIESGKIEINTFDTKSELLQVKFIADSSNTSEYLGTFPHRYIEIKQASKLNLISSCCDGFDHQFERMK